MAINPRGRIKLGKTNRDMTPPDNFFKKKSGPRKAYIRPFGNIESRNELKEIKAEVKRLFEKTTKTKTIIINLLKDKFDFTDDEARTIFRSSMQNSKKWKNG